MRNLKRGAAVIGATAVIAAAGLGGVMSAQATPSNGPDKTSVEEPESSEVAEVDDGPNQGPDANPNEPGHQDADESGESE